MRFLLQVAQQLSKSHPKDLHHVCVVWPNRRAGYLFLESFKEIQGFKGFLPKVLTIDELVEVMSSLKVIQPLDLRCLFYETYQKNEQNAPKESFMNFLTWGEILLSDFDQIDFQLAPAKEIFSYLQSLRDIDHWSKNFGKKEGLKEKYLQQWQFYYPLYDALNLRLNSMGQGYRGKVYRKAANNAETFWQQTENTWYFAGFNALSQAEEQILSTALSSKKAKALWDFDPFFIKHTEYEAGYFIKKIINNKMLYPQEALLTESSFEKPKYIEIRAVSGHINQAKNLGHLLAQLQEDEADLTQTTVILPDENLLTPVLNALPVSLTEVNVTMGYPMLNRPSVQCFKKLITWWQLHHEGKEIHFSDLLEVCELTIVFSGDTHFNRIIENIKARHQTDYLLDKNLSILPEALSPLVKTVFSPYNYNQLFDYLRAVIEACLYQIEINQTDFNIIKEELFKIYNAVNQLEILTAKYQFLSEGKLLTAYFEEMMTHQSLSLRGEPNKGLQIMGMLESRNLDFDHVIFLSANEGMLPPENSRNSLLPFEVRLAFGLPKFEESDALYAYHFYRLISKAKKIYFFHNANMAGLGASEPSRYIKQLDLNSPHTVSYKNVETNLQPPVSVQKQLIKNAKWIEILSQRAVTGLSPSLLTSYIYDPWKFYETYMLGINEETEVEETLSERSIGNVVHKVLEELYAPYKNQYIQLEDFEKLLKVYPQQLEKAFELQYPGGNMEMGKNILIKEVIKKQVERLIYFDLQEIKKGNQLYLIDVERKFHIPFPVSEVPVKIFLKGIVDRIDKIATPSGEFIRIIDYKTGNVDPTQLNIKDFNELIEDYKFSKAFQLLVYATALKDDFDLPLQAGIISFKKFGKGLMLCQFEDKETYISTEVLEKFKVVLSQLISEIFDAQTALVEKK